jgi:hypothetical protein
MGIGQNQPGGDESLPGWLSCPDYEAIAEEFEAGQAMAPTAPVGLALDEAVG